MITSRENSWLDLIKLNGKKLALNHHISKFLDLCHLKAIYIIMSFSKISKLLQTDPIFYIPKHSFYTEQFF